MSNVTLPIRPRDQANGLGQHTSRTEERMVFDTIRGIPGLRKAATLRSCWMGKMTSVATAGANHTTINYRTIETHTDRIRVGIFNPCPTLLSGVKVNIGTSDTLPALLAGLGGSGANISGGTQVLSAAFDVPAGTVDAPGFAWSPWIDISTIDRIDFPGERPLLRVLIEVAGATNANRPALSVAKSRAAWENPANVGGRVMKCRSEVQLGATTPGTLGSTVYANDTMPNIIDYAPRNGRGMSGYHFGDSLTEAVDADIEGYGWMYMARDRVSSISSPIEICNLAAASTTTTEFRARIEALAPILNPELVIVPRMTPNGFAAPTFTDVGAARTMRRNYQAIQVACAAVNAALVGWSGLPIQAIAPDIIAGYKVLDATSAAFLNKYMAEVLLTLPLIDAYTPLLGGYDANNQAYLKPGTAAGNLHINGAGHLLASNPYEAFLRANQP